MDVSCKEVLEQLQCSLAVLAAAIKRATSAAEKLGAVHQVGEGWRCWGHIAGAVPPPLLALVGFVGTHWGTLGVGRECFCTQRGLVGGIVHGDDGN